MKSQRFIEELFGCTHLLTRMLLIGAVLLAPAFPCFAKISEGAVVVNKDNKPKSFLLGDKLPGEFKHVILKPINIQQFLDEDLARAKESKGPLPLRFAVTADETFDLKSVIPANLSDGRLWRLSIKSPNAKSLSLGITRFDMPEGAKLWIYDPGHTQVDGPYTARHRSPIGSLWTPVITGDEIILEVFVPTNIAQPVLEIKINQGYQGFEKIGVQSSVTGLTEASCNIDVVCYPNKMPLQVNAVGVYTFSGTPSSSCPKGLCVCTGTLMNNTKQDHTPYFLTANHCVSNQAGANSVVVYWHYQSKNDPCTTPPKKGPHTPDQNQVRKQVGGADWLAGADYVNQSDFSLLQLKTKPETCTNSAADPCYKAKYAGWDIADTAPTQAVGIHHPRGDAKAFSFSNNVGLEANFPEMWKVFFNDGITQPGSSGSCLFDATPNSGTHHSYGRCIGQLNGLFGLAPDPNNLMVDYCLNPLLTQGRLYGRFAKDWAHSTGLRAKLDPKGIIKPIGTPSGMDGDPHITTADGTHYDFQGAGEYVALRDANGLEIQTRQSPIATTFDPPADGHDGLATCVSLNTAVAAQVGEQRVTYQPNLSGVPDPRNLQLRIDGGDPITLGENGLDIKGGGHIANSSSAPGGLEITFPDASVLSVIPGWWDSQSKWYLNVGIVRPGISGMDEDTGEGAEASAPTIAANPLAEGLMGAIPEGSWLPALPGGKSMGKMPIDVHQRYVDLYQKFGEAWRVNDKTSLFDYAKDTSTDTFTKKDWPKEHAPCDIPGTIPVKPTSERVAKEACRLITDTAMKANCIFDVRVTGNTGFAQTYLYTQQLQPGATTTTVKDDRDPTFYGEHVTFTATVAQAVPTDGRIPSGTVQFFLDNGKVGAPVKLENGHAAWKWDPSHLQVDLRVGKHLVWADYNPSPGSTFLPSRSPDESHLVIEADGWTFWLVILAFVILILLVIWKFLR